ncbi:MAG TPA: hypothetical protein VK498_05600 [Ferruginibacter sp.]|nr:hypothetical protein [Ferruginibacter sp.]
MIDKIYRLIYLSSIVVIGLGISSFLLGMYFFDNYKNYPSLEKIVAPLILGTPFVPLGTLFGTLKERQSVKKKLIIILLTSLSVLFLLFLVWGILYATAFD